MDQIRLTGVRAVGKHGVLDFEHERAQTFVVDATLFLDLAPAGHSDDLHDTVDYGAIAKGIVAIIEGDHVDLIEKLADRIASMILEYPAVARTQVTVHKPSAPIVVPFDDVSVTVERSRETTSAASQVHHAIIAMGGNQGDVVDTLRDAVRSIDGLASTQVTGISPLYRTDAWGMPDGTPDFYNAVVSVTTKLSAMELLRGLQRIEAEHGRVRTDHWTSRTLDLDIIDFDGQSSDDPDLTLPHPRAWQRAFVLGPWLALEPDANCRANMPVPWLNSSMNRPIATISTKSQMIGWWKARPATVPTTLPAMPIMRAMRMIWAKRMMRSIPAICRKEPPQPKWPHSLLHS